MEFRQTAAAQYPRLSTSAAANCLFLPLARTGSAAASVLECGQRGRHTIELPPWWRAAAAPSERGGDPPGRRGGAELNDPPSGDTGNGCIGRGADTIRSCRRGCGREAARTDCDRASRQHRRQRRGVDRRAARACGGRDSRTLPSATRQRIRKTRRPWCSVRRRRASTVGAQHALAIMARRSLPHPLPMSKPQLAVAFPVRVRNRMHRQFGALHAEMRGRR